MNATANVPGTFVYTPALATVLSYGTSPLSVHFTPTDTTDYTTATASVSITVNLKGGLIVDCACSLLLRDFEIPGNVEVTQGTLTLYNMILRNNLTMSGGSLILTGSNTVQGNLQINGGGTFNIGPGSTIQGNLQIQSLPSATGQNQVCGTTVQGNLQLDNNGTAVEIGSSSPNSCAGNTISGNLQAVNNTALVQIYDNTVGNNLKCSSNSPLPGGMGNTAKQKQGQCAAF